MTASIDQLRRGTFPTAMAGYGAAPATLRATDVAIASDGQRYLCVWGEEETPPKYQHTVHSRWLGADGVPLSAEVIHGEIQNILSPSVVFDGLSFVVAFGNADAQLMIARVRDGIYEPASTAPVDYGSYGPTFGMAANQRASLLFWKSTALQMVAAPLPIPIVGPSHPGTVISLGNAQRSSLQAVWRGDHYLASWTETGGYSTAVYGRFDANGKAMDGAGVALSYGGGGGLSSDGDNALIVWSGQGINVSLVDRLGHATTTKIFDRSAATDAPVVTWNGQEYVALWMDVPVTYTWRTMAARIGRKGELIAPPSAIGTDSLPGLNFIFPIESGYYATVQMLTGFCFPMCQPPTTLRVAFLSPDLRLIGKSEVLSVPAGAEYEYGHWSSAPAFAKRGEDALVVWGQNDWCCSDTLLRGARISGTGLVIDRPQGFAIGKGTHVRGVVATPDGFDVVGGASAWSVSADARSITPTSAYAFVPADQSSYAFDAPNPYAQLVPGGPRPLIIYQHPSDDQHDIPYYVGAFAPPARLRAVRP